MTATRQIESLLENKPDEAAEAKRLTALVRDELLFFPNKKHDDTSVHPLRSKEELMKELPIKKKSDAEMTLCVQNTADYLKGILSNRLNDTFTRQLIKNGKGGDSQAQEYLFQCMHQKSIREENEAARVEWAALRRRKLLKITSSYPASIVSIIVHSLVAQALRMATCTETTALFVKTALQKSRINTKLGFVDLLDTSKKKRHFNNLFGNQLVDIWGSQQWIIKSHNDLPLAEMAVAGEFSLVARDPQNLSASIETYQIPCSADVRNTIIQITKELQKIIGSDGVFRDLCRVIGFTEQEALLVEAKLLEINERDLKEWCAQTDVPAAADEKSVTAGAVIKKGSELSKEAARLNSLVLSKVKFFPNRQDEIRVDPRKSIAELISTLPILKAPLAIWEDLRGLNFYFKGMFSNEVRDGFNEIVGAIGLGDTQVGRTATFDRVRSQAFIAQDLGELGSCAGFRRRKLLALTCDYPAILLDIAIEPVLAEAVEVATCTETAYMFCKEAGQNSRVDGRVKVFTVKAGKQVHHANLLESKAETVLADVWNQSHQVLENPAKMPLADIAKAGQFGPYRSESLEGFMPLDFAVPFPAALLNEIIELFMRWKDVLTNGSDVIDDLHTQMKFPQKTAARLQKKILGIVERELACWQAIKEKSLEVAETASFGFSAKDKESAAVLTQFSLAAATTQQAAAQRQAASVAGLKM